MAVTQNTYTGNGSTTNYSFTFPYLETTDIKVFLNGVLTTAYTFANATTIQFNTAPANGAKIDIYRVTDDSSLQATFYPGSAIRSSDLNDNFTQNLYVTQESNREAAYAITVAAGAVSTANSATTTANGAVATANAATATANTASSNASAAVTTANTANTNASAAVSTANTASTNAAAAVSTSNAALTTAASAAYDAGTAITTANSAVSTANAATATANTASTAANNAVSTANTAATNASNAVTTANSAVTTAGNAVTTANSAVSTANSATSTANTALSTANAAASAVANAILYDTVANVAAIPASPVNNDAVEVVDSTGIESFTPLSGVPGGFTGSSGLSVRIVYTTTGNTWNWIQYFPNDPESRYLKLSGGTLTGQLKADDSTSVASPVIAFDGDTNTGIAHTGADELALVTGGTARLTVDPSGNVAVAGGLTKGGNNVVTTGDTGTVTSTMILDGTIVNGDINANAAIDKTKISGTAITAADTGTVTSTMIANGTIVDDDISASAAISGSKVQAGTTTNPGVLQLTDSTSSTSTTTAATPNSVKSVYDLVSGAGFPAGTTMLFVQTSAPTGWTKVTTHNDKALRVVSGSASSGGSTAFSTVFASRTPAGTVQGTTLTTSQIPSHKHALFYINGYTGGSGATNFSFGNMFMERDSAGNFIYYNGTQNLSRDNYVSNTGGGGSHDHGFTGTAMDFAVQYVDVIIATKN